MDAGVLNGAVELHYDQQLKQIAQDVMIPLMNGLHSFNHVSEMLLCMEPSISLCPETYCYQDIREQIEKMNQQMQESKSIADTALRRIDEETEHLTAEKNRLEIQKSQRMRELEALKMTLQSHRSNLERYRGSLDFAKIMLQVAQETRDKMQRRRDGAERNRNIGAGLFAIPIWGWIAGAVMVGVSVKEMDETNAAVTRANEEVNNCESQVDTYSAKVSEYSSRIYQAERDIDEADRKISETEAKLRSVSVKREFVADVQEKIRRAVHQLGQLCVVGSVAEVQTRNTIELKPLVKVFEDMTTALSRITGEDLLHTQDMLCDMKENQRKLQQLVDSNKSLGDTDYY